MVCHIQIVGFAVFYVCLKLLQPYSLQYGFCCSRMLVHNLCSSLATLLYELRVGDEAVHHGSEIVV